MGLMQRLKCERSTDGTSTCWSFDTGQEFDWETEIRPLIHSGDAQYVGKDPLNYLVKKALSNEIYYQNSAITDLEVVNFLGTGLSPVYTAVRDDATLFTTIPEDANGCTIEIQGTGVGIKWLVESVPGNTGITQLRDNGELAADGDRITLNSINEIEKFAFISAATIPAPRVANAKVIVTYSRTPEDGRSH